MNKQSTLCDKNELFSLDSTHKESLSTMEEFEKDMKSELDINDSKHENNAFNEGRTKPFFPANFWMRRIQINLICWLINCFCVVLLYSNFIAISVLYIFSTLEIDLVHSIYMMLAISFFVFPKKGVFRW